jgi:hypothetical protein
LLGWEHLLSTTFNVFLRIIATFIASALGVIGAGAVMGVDLWLAMAMGGILAVAKVIERLAVAFLEDGKLTKAEINAAFAPAMALKGVDSDGNATRSTRKSPARRKPAPKNNA